MSTVIDAASNPAQATQIIDQVMSMVNTPEPQDVVIDSPSLTITPPPLDLVVDLPGGHITLTGEVVNEAEVRELTGRDEEALASTSTQDKLLNEVLVRGVVRVGNEKATEAVLNDLLAGDRDFLLLRIYIATFGKDLTAYPYCRRCEDRKAVTIDLSTDVPTRKLESAMDRFVHIDTPSGAAKLELPTGRTQRKMMVAAERSEAELSTILLEGTVSEINGNKVYSPSQVLDIPIRTRKALVNAILVNAPGPKMSEITSVCPDCESGLEVPLSLAGLFRFQ